MSLTIAIPVSRAGVSRLKASVDSIEFFEGLRNHQIIFLPTPSVQQQVGEQAARLKAVCDATFIAVLPRDHEPQGPFGAFNGIFRDSVEVLSARGNKNPWMWWEEDMTVIRAGIWDRLELEYHRAGQPCMGVRRPASSVMRNLDGTALATSDPRAQGDYMVAVGIYPAEFKDYSCLYKYPDPSGNMPTDVAIRHEINKHLHHTPLIGHHWNTGNYRRNQQGQIVCDDLNPKEGHPTYGGVISDMAFCVHGCKDGTLARLILAETPGNVVSSGIPQPIRTVAPDPDTALLVAQNEEMRRDIATLQEQWRVKENSYAEEIERLKGVVDSISDHPAITSQADLAAAVKVNRLAAGIDAEIAAEITEQPVPTLQAIKKHLQATGKAIQLSSLAADFKINKTLLRGLLETDPTILVGKGGLAWVSLAA